ncbi:hypothetical protein VBZ51_08350 [Maribacter sp. HS]|uniref:hypothetical protein n=1 Tax=Maribacter sp. HS TaxID=3110480 RepID=UPI003A843F46
MKKDKSQTYPLNILEQKDLHALYKMFGLVLKDKQFERLEKILPKLLLPANGFLQSEIDYDHFMNKLANKNNIILDHFEFTHEKEASLFQKLFAKNFNELTSEEREKFIENLKVKGLTTEQITALMGFTTVGAVNLSGFAVYVLAAKTASVIANVFNLTLPFVFYTTMSKVISVTTNPAVAAAIAGTQFYNVFKAFEGVENWGEFKDRSAEHYNGFQKTGKAILKGNYEAGEAAFKYWASCRIIKIYQAQEELDLTCKNTDQQLNKKKEFKEERLNFDEKIQEFEHKLESKQVEIERLKNQISELEIQARAIKDEKALVLKKQQHIDENINAVEIEINKESDKRKSLEQRLKKLKE